MEKKQLIKFDNSIYRVLSIQNEEVLLIDCIKRNMEYREEESDGTGFDQAA